MRVRRTNRTIKWKVKWCIWCGIGCQGEGENGEECRKRRLKKREREGNTREQRAETVSSIHTVTEIGNNQGSIPPGTRTGISRSPKGPSEHPPDVGGY